MNSRNFVTFIQFLNYVQNLDFEIKYMDQIFYRVVVFRLQDFLQLQNKSNNQYQLEKVKHFLKELETRILLTSFIDIHFQSLIAVPLVNFIKVQKFWVGRVWLAQGFKLIQNEFVLVLKTNKVKTVTKLTTNLISGTKSLHFKEFIKI